MAEPQRAGESRQPTDAPTAETGQTRSATMDDLTRYATDDPLAGDPFVALLHELRRERATAPAAGGD